MATLGLIFCALLLLFTSSVSGADTNGIILDLNQMDYTRLEVRGPVDDGRAFGKVERAEIGIHSQAESASTGKYCVANPKADEKVLLGRIQYYCSSPLIDCKAIQPGEACFEPNNTFFHASVVFNSYYKFSHCAEDQCHDGDGSGMVLTTDPSTPECHFV